MSARVDCRTWKTRGSVKEVKFICYNDMPLMTAGTWQLRPMGLISFHRHAPTRSGAVRGTWATKGRLQNLVPKGQHLARTVQYFVHELQHLANTVQFLAAPAAFDILTNRKWQS